MTKKAILLVSTGTGRVELLECTTLQLFKEIKERFQDYQYYLAFSSRSILEKMNERSDAQYLGVQEAFLKMQSDGIQEVLVQPTFLLDGSEYDKLRGYLADYRESFQRIELGLPLLGNKEDMVRTLHAILKHAELEPEEALVLIGHGTVHSANTTYQNLEYTAYVQGNRNVFVGTTETGKNRIMLMRKLKASGFQKVCLMPLLFVAGYHAMKDISADSGSWKSDLSEAGYEIRVFMKGLGEIKEIRDIFLNHIAQ